MADYQLDKVASDVNDTINGAVVSNASQSLSEAEKAQARENIGAVAFGSLLQIKGHYSTVTELEEAVPSPNVGDPYSVGSVVPYDLYIFDGLTNAWLNYGPIRGTDISARSIQNYSIASSSWVFDDSLYEDYQYKARITISEITANDMPIVVFEPNDAVSGNFSPVCYCFAGYAEIWAKSVPNGSITLPVVTYLVNVSNGKGITNASGGINAGSITTDKYANLSVTGAKIANGAVTRDKQSGDALYSPTVLLTSDRTITVDDIGKTLNSGWASTAVTRTLSITAESSSVIPVGAEIAICRLYERANCNITISGARVIHDGRQIAIATNTITLNIPAMGGMIALKKFEQSSSNGDVWLVTGNVEVVT